MARQSQRIEFESFADMAAHLDRWATTGLATTAGWEDALVMSQSWLDYSPRNQALLASYGANGPVAGVETWRLVPSTHEDRGCAVRAGEHGYPVRVPVTTGGTEPDPYVGGSRPTRAAVERWEWRPVFGVDQLARRPAPDALTPPDLPATLTGPQADAEFLAAARKVATATVRGRLPKSDDPHHVLADAAGRLRRSSKRPDLDPVLRAQVAWLVADRVGLAPGDRPPGFDPSGLKPRERWERLQDVLEPARKLTAGLGVAVGVDLVASPLPRMEIIDDRVVPAGRRHRLPAASLEQLPVGRWVTVGPYTPGEWAARGEQASGQGAYLRLNKTAYLSAVEHGDTAGWRLEDVATRTGHGVLATGTAATLDQARDDAGAAVGARYPALAAPVDVTGPSPGGSAGGWEAMPGQGRSAAQLRHLNDQVTIYAIPGPGGRWMPAVHHGPTGAMDRLPYTRTLDQACDAAELAGQRAMRTLAVADPARLDTTITAFAGSDDYSRNELTALVGHRLHEPDRQRLSTAEPAALVELLSAAGLTPAATVAVLHAEQLHADTVAQLLPTVGVPMTDAIRVLRDHWDLPASNAATTLGATAAEMRDAGCSATEIMATRPRDILRALPDDAHLWELAGGTMAAAGHNANVVAGHLVAHAPTPDTFAAGITAGIDDPGTGLTLAARHGATGDQLAAASEAYGLSPAETATALVDASAHPPVVLDTLDTRCDHDTETTITIATGAGIGEDAVHAWLNPAPVPAVTSVTTTIGAGDTAALLAVLPPPGPSTESDPTRLLDTLRGIEPTHLEPVHP